MPIEAGSELITATYLVVEKNESIQDLQLEVYTSNMAADEIRLLGNYHINLQNQSVAAQNIGELFDKTYDEYVYENAQFDMGETAEESDFVDADDTRTLYHGLKMYPQVAGIQTAHKIDVTAENQEKYGINYDNYAHGEFLGQTHGLLEDDGTMEILIDLGSLDEGENLSIVQYENGDIFGETAVDMGDYLKLNFS